MPDEVLGSPPLTPLSPLADEEQPQLDTTQLEAPPPSPEPVGAPAAQPTWPGATLPAYEHVVGDGDEQHLANAPEDIVSMVDKTGGVRGVPYAQLKDAEASGLQIADPAHVDDWAKQGDQVSMLDPASGNVHVVPKAQYDEAVQSGLQVATPHDRAAYNDANPVVFMRSPDGAVDAKQRRDMGTFAQQGWLRASDEDVAKEYGDTGSSAAYLADRAGSGAMAHLYKPAAQVFGGDDLLAEIEARENAAKGTNLEIAGHIAEGAGVVASSLATGGMGVGAQIAKSGATMAAGQLGVKAAATKVATAFLSNAAEGLVYGGLSRTGDGLTGDAPLDVENIALGSVKDAGWSGLIGGGLATLGLGVKAGAEAAGDLTRRVMGKAVAGKTLPEAIDTMASEWRFNQLAGSAKAEAKKIGREMGPDGTAAVGKWLNDKNVPLEAKDAFEAITGHMDAAIEAQRTLVSGLDSLGVKPDTRPLASLYAQHIDGLLAQPETRKVGAQLRGELQPIIQDLAKAPGSPGKSYNTIDRLWDLRKKLDHWAKFDATKSNDLTDAFRQLRGATEDNFKAIADDIVTKNPTAALDNPKWSADWQAAKDETRMAMTAQRVAQNKLAAQQGNNALGLRASLAGIGAGEAVTGLVHSTLGTGAAIMLGPLAGIGTSIASHGVSKYGPGLFAKGLSTVSKAAREGGAISQLANTIPKTVGHAVDIVDSATKHAALTLSRGIGTMQLSAPKQLTPEHISQAITAAQQLMSGNGPAFDHADDALDTVAQAHGLKFADAMQANIAARSQFILDKVQANPGAAGQKKVVRYLSAMSEPHKAFQRVASGVASDEDVETLKALYPQSFNTLAGNIAQHLQTTDVRTNPTALRKFQRQLGISSDVQLGMTLQAVAKGPPQQSPQASGKPAMAKGGGHSIDVSKNLLSPSSGASAMLGS